MWETEARTVIITHKVWVSPALEKTRAGSAAGRSRGSSGERGVWVLTRLWRALPPLKFMAKRETLFIKVGWHKGPTRESHNLRLNVVESNQVWAVEEHIKCHQHRHISGPPGHSSQHPKEATQRAASSPEQELCTSKDTERTSCKWFEHPCIYNQRRLHRSWKISNASPICPSRSFLSIVPHFPKTLFSPAAL